MKNNLVLSFFLILLIISLALFAKDSIVNSSGEVVFETGHRFEVEYADTQRERIQGFSGRDTLEKGNGMLFVFQKEDIYSFWMKDTYIPLDMIWIDKELEVVHIERNVRPESYFEDPPGSFKSILPAMYVLEINANEGDGIDIGDKVESTGYK